MRILQYNILNGCRKDPDRLTRLGTWLKEQAYPVVGFNELNGWHRPPGMRGRAEELGYPYAELLVTKRSPHFVGVMSQQPIEVIETRDAGFHHGVIHVVIQDTHYVITHLIPRLATKREKEAQRLADMVRDVTEPLVLMGDMNNLSPLDREEHIAVGLVEALRSEAHLRLKFLTRELDINYRSMQTLMDAGLTDLGAGVPGEYSVPTPFNVDLAHATRMRLDYVLVNDAFLERAPRARILRGGQLDTLSDHYPVECSWE